MTQLVLPGFEKKRLTHEEIREIVRRNAPTFHRAIEAHKTAPETGKEKKS